MINQHECICEAKTPGHKNIKRNLTLSTLMFIAVLIYGLVTNTTEESTVSLALMFLAFVIVVVLAIALFEKFRGKHTFKCSLYRAYSSPAIAVFQALKI